MYKLMLTNDDGSEVIDLLHGPLRVYNWGWSPKFTSLRQRAVNLPFGYQTTSVGYGAVTETFSLSVEGCADDIRDRVAQLERFLEGAAAHMDDPLVENAHWLEWSSGGEEAKRSLVTGGAVSALSGVGHWPMLSDERLNLTLALTRHPLWENATKTNISQDSTWTIGGQWPINNIPGRVPARLWQTIFSDDTGLYSGVDDFIQTIWAGFRPEYRGLTNFRARWECESTAVGGDSGAVIGYLDAGQSLDAADATATNGQKCRTTFTDTVLQDRLFIDVYTVNGSAVLNSSHFAGRYLVLARCKIDDDTKAAHLQMRYGYKGSSILTSCDPVTVTNEKWLFRELGTIQIPPIGLVPEGTYSDYDAQCAAFAIVLYSQNTSATWMDIDCLVLVPADYFVKLEYANVEDVAGDTNHRTIAAVLPDDRAVAYEDDANTGGTYRVLSSVSMSPNQWYLPIGDSVLVLAAQEDDVQVLEDYLDLTIAYYPRWQSYRD